MPELHQDTESDNQQGRLLRIETVLDAAEKGLPGDPLLLIKVEGEEGISMPYHFDLIMYRSAAKNKARPIAPEMLINTAATIHIRGEPQDSPFASRRGIFKSFQKLDSAQPEDYVRFGGRLVAPFTMLELEAVFRVFENQSVLDTIKQVLESGTTIDINYLDFSALDQMAAEDPHAFPVLEYCVQFGESSFNFVSRLMREYGIWYYFGRGAAADSRPPFLADNDTMIFGKGPLAFLPCDERGTTLDHMTLDIGAPKFAVGIGDEADRTICGFWRSYTPVYEQFKVGNFNPLDPASPFEYGERLTPEFDVSNAASGSTDRFRREIFPVMAVMNDQSAGGGGAKRYEDARGYDDNRRSEAEAEVYSVSGISKNPLFIPGRAFTIKTDLTLRGEEGKSLGLSWVRISAFETGYRHITLASVLSDVLNNFWGPKGTADITLTDAAQGLNNWLKNELGNVFAPSTIKSPDFLTYFSAGGLANITAALPGVIEAFVEAFAKGQSAFSNSFVALAKERPPLPQAAKPIAHGPHLGIVIGPDPQNELDTSKQDIYADALGRVRVRFPWDRQDYKYHQPQLGATRPACWVRVSEGWASRTYGTQFLPRIGDEVVVEFLDGDPDRPIITGRVYNARRTGRTNLPFPDPSVRNTPLTGADDYVNLPNTAPTGPQFQRSGIKTQSTPRGAGDPARYHLLRFDDTRNKEQYLIRSQARMDVTAFASYFDTTGGDRHLTIGGPKGGGNMFVKMFGNYEIHVLKDRREQIDQNYGMNVGGKTLWVFNDDRVSWVLGTDMLTAVNVSINATENITLQAGSSMIVITPAGVSIDAPMVQINSGGSVPALQPANPAIPPPQDPSAADPGDDER
jgi:uncharacterized protein involved in type VI secretion and phage assembly